MSRVPTGGGQYLKASEVMDGDTAVIRTEADWVDTQYTKEDGTKKQQYVCTVDYKGEERRLKLTMASCEALVIMGSDSNDWIGKTIKMTKVKVQVGSKIYDSIFCEPAGILQPTEPEPINPNTNEQPWDE